MSVSINMEKLREIEELLSFIPTKSVDEFANINNGKKIKSSNFKINNDNNILSLNEISNKIHEKISNFNTNKGKKKNRGKTDNNKKSNDDENNQSKKPNKKVGKKNEDKMETDI